MNSSEQEGHCIRLLPDIFYIRRNIILLADPQRFCRDFFYMVLIFQFSSDLPLRGGLEFMFRIRFYVMAFFVI